MYSAPIAQIRACAAAVSAGRQMQDVPGVALARLPHGTVVFGVVRARQSCRQADGGREGLCGGPWLPLRFPRMLCRGAELCLAVSPLHYVLSPGAWPSPERGTAQRVAAMGESWWPHKLSFKRHLNAAGLQCIGLVLKEALRSAWLHGQVIVAD